MTRQPFQGKTLMAILAHPDDEAFGLGGTLSRYKDLGAQTIVVCATRGEAGKCGDPPLCKPEELGQVREMETRCSCNILQVNQLHFLDYRDQDTNMAEPLEIVGKMVQLIRRYRPDAVITFGPDGLSGHKDHTAVGHYATMAYLLSEDVTAYPGQEAFRPQYLYYLCLLKRMTRIMGRGFGKPDQHIHVAVPIRDYLDKKRAAIQCHQTQIMSIRRIGYLSDPYVADPEVDEIRSFEYFYQAFPLIPIRRRDEPWRNELF